MKKLLEVGVNKKFHKLLKKYKAVLNVDFPVTEGARLKVKLVVFPDEISMSRFYIDFTGESIEGGKACVMPFSGTRECQDENGKWDTRMIFDPKYICVMLFTKEWLGMESICHESTHAGFAYARRIKSSPWDKYAEISGDEELVAYPTGRIARMVTKILYEKGFLM